MVKQFSLPEWAPQTHSTGICNYNQATECPLDKDSDIPHTACSFYRDNPIINCKENCPCWQKVEVH